VDGKGSRKFGLESDEFSEERIHALGEASVAPYLKTDPAIVKRRVAMRKLQDAIQAFMLEKIPHPNPPVPRVARA
jgi:hypothetical protein